MAVYAAHNNGRVSDSRENGKGLSQHDGDPPLSQPHGSEMHQVHQVFPPHSYEGEQRSCTICPATILAGSAMASLERGTATIDMNGDDVQQSRERSQEFHIDLSLGARTRRRCAAPSVESRAVLADAQVSTVRSRRQPVGLLWSPQDHSLGGETRSPSHDFGRESSAHEHGAVRDASSLPTPGPSFVETQGWAQASANYTAGRTSISSDETSRTA